MKNILRAIMSLLLFVACTTTEESPSSVPNGGNESVTPSITLEQNYLNFNEHADVQTISFSSTMDWTAELINDRADGWCSISATSGTAGSKDIDVTVTENTSTDDRTASVIIKSGAISKTVRISQKQRDALTVTASTFEIEGTSGKIYIEVKANVDFEYTINGSAAEWITPIETRAMKTTTLGFNIAENKTMQRREGTITIHSGDLSETVTVYQKDHGDAILLSQNEYVVSDTGEDIAVEVTSNVDVEIEMPDVDWITRNTSRAVSTNTYYFTIAENTSYDQREAYITFKNTEKKISERVKVSQVQKDAIVLAAEQYNVTSEGEQITIELGHNVDFEFEIVGDWITHVETRAMQTNYLVFEVASNASYDSREGSVIFTANNGSLTQVAKIFQAQKDAIIISDNDIVVSDASQQISFDVETNIDFSVIDPDVDWLHPVVTRGLTTHTLTYTVDENTTYDSREAQIVVKNNATNITQTVTVTQAQKDAIVLAKSEYNITSEGEQITIELGHNVDFEFEIVGDWITHVETRALQTNYLVFEVASNASYDSREGSVIFTANNGSLTQVAKIFQAQRDAIIISDNDIVVSDASQQISFDVETNIDFSVINPDVDWLHPVVTRGLTTHTLTYTVDENTTYDSREAQIVVKNNATNITQTVTVTQAQKDAIVLAKSEYEIELEGGALDFDIQTNVEVSVSISEDAQSWITQLQTRGLETRTLYFDIAPYDGDATREGTITISGGNATQTITICQRGIVILDTPNYNEIYYTTNDRKTITPNMEHWDETIISNIYDKELGYGIITFNGDIETIGGNAFHNCSSLKSIKIPESVTEIGGTAFYECSSLTDINIPQNVTIIGEVAFASCVSLKDITIPDGVTQIEYATFCDCLGLESITIPEGVTTIGDRVFEQCRSLTNVTIPANVTKIGESTFKYCENLATVTFEGNKVEVISPRAFQDCSSLTDINLPEGVITIGDEAFRGCSALTSINIPASITFIGIYAFDCENLKQFKGKLASNDGYCIIIDGTLCTFVHGSGLTEYTIPDNVTTIGECAFEGCNLTNITIPDNVTSIGRYSFRWGKFTSITIPKNVTWIGEQAFAYSNLTSLYCRPITPPSAELSNIIDRENCTIFVPIESIDAYRTAESWKEHANKIVGYDFDNSGEINPNAQIYYTSSDGNVVNPAPSTTWGDAGIISNTYKDGQGVITFSQSLTEIGAWAFNDCSTLTSVILPNSVTSIGNSAFQYCDKLTDIKLGTSLEHLGDKVFWNCPSLTNISIPDGVKEVPYDAFSECYSLAKITLGSGVEKIGSHAFYNNYALTSMTLPENVKTIEVNAFSGCKNLQSIVIPNQVETIGETAFSGCEKLVSITLGSGLREIKNNAFMNCSALSGIVIPNSVRVIGYEAFKDCVSLAEVTLGSGLEVIESYTFNNCQSLKSITIPNNIKIINEYAFQNCESLASIEFGNGLEKIDGGAFNSCSALKSVTIPSGVDIIGNPFSGCSGITAFYGEYASEDNKTLIKDGEIIAIADYANLTEYTIPNGVTKIGNNAFQNWESIKIVNISDSVTEIGNSAFDHCSNLAEVNLGNGLEIIGEKAFWWCTSLKRIAIPDGVKEVSFDAFSECHSLAEVTLGSGVEKIGNYAFNNNYALTSITLPNSVKNIGDHAFQSCTALTGVTLSDNVETIGSGVFNNCQSLEYAILSQKLAEIPREAFEGCKSLLSIDIPDGVKRIGGSAFNFCDNLTTVTMSDSVECIDGWAFRCCPKLSDITFSKNITFIGDHSFYDTYFTSITIPYAVDKIGNGAFSNISVLRGFENSSKLTETVYRATTEDSRCLVENERLIAWAYADLNEYTIPSYSYYPEHPTNPYQPITTLASYSFAYAANVERIIIPEGITKIESAAFWTNNGVREVTVPESITIIENDAFYGCSSLSKVYCKAVTPPSFGDSVFSYSPSGRTIYVPRESVEAYKSAPGWSNYADAIQGYDF